MATQYAVSAYLIIFERNTKFSSRWSLATTYALVILSSDILHFFLGGSLAGMVINVVIGFAFVTFTNLAHPPAIALTIFSYIAGNPLDFTISSVPSLGALLAASLITEKYGS